MTFRSSVWKVLCSSVLASSLVSIAQAQLRVPADFPTIQSAIDNASSNETVLVSAGTYFENINFKGKAITVRSESGPENTIIDGGAKASTVAFGSGEGNGSVLHGFTIQNGLVHVGGGLGGGVSVTFCSPTITGNIIRNNQQGTGGAAALACNGSSPVITSNLFLNNSGGPVISFVNYSQPLIANNVFANNPGTAIYLQQINPTVVNNTFISNTVGIHIKSFSIYSVEGFFANNLLTFNQTGLRIDFTQPVSFVPVWLNNLVSGGQDYVGIPSQTGTNGNLTGDPFLACVPAGDFQLLHNSVCIDAGTNVAGLVGATDVTGRPRILSGSTNGPAIVDIGAYEFDLTNAPAACLFLVCPSNMVVVAAAGENSAVVSYPTPFATPGVVFSNSPPSGVSFPEGDNIVNVSAYYGTNLMTCNFTISVLRLDDLARSLNTSNFVWTSGNPTPWFVQTEVTHDGFAAARSGVITNNQTSTLGATTSGPGTLTFWWKVSSEVNRDILSLKLNGATQAAISGNVDWRLETVYLGAGQQSLEWVYSKDAIGSSGLDAGWLDIVSFTPGSTAPIITTQPLSQSKPLGWDAAFTVSATGTPPINFQWRLNGVELPGATESNLIVTNLQVTNFGTYSVVVSNAASFTTSQSAILDRSEVVAWGANTYGQTTVPFGLTNVIAVAGGWYHSMALRSNGTVVAWGRNNAGQTNVPAGLSNVIAIASRSGNHSMALGANGLVTVWGDNSHQQTNVPASLSNVVAIAAGGTHCLALRSNGTVVSWGIRPIPAGLTNIVAIAAGDDTSLFLRSDGTVVRDGGPAVPTGLSNVTAIAAGAWGNLALTSDGTLTAWANVSAVPAGLSNVVAIGVGDYHACALKTDGTVASWGTFYTASGSIPATAPPTSKNVQALVAGSDHDIALVGYTSPVLRALEKNARLEGNSFALTIPTQSGRVYRLEFTESLAASNWVALPLVAGTGSDVVLIDPGASAAQRFYRVRSW